MLNMNGSSISLKNEFLRSGMPNLINTPETRYYLELFHHSALQEWRVAKVKHKEIEAGDPSGDTLVKKIAARKVLETAFKKIQSILY